jgi:uncharacterized protein YbjT (DUF2867 family)
MQMSRTAIGALIAPGQARRMTHTTTQQRTALVIGGTGKTGRRVAQRRAALGVPIRLGTRSSEPAFDWEDPSTWEASLQDVGAAYLAYQPDAAAPGAAEAIGAFSALAVASGVQRLVLLSGRGEPEAQRGELAVQQSGASWTVLRASWFDQNFSEGLFLPSVLGGDVALPAGDVLEPFVDVDVVDDIADVAVAALTGPGHEDQVYEMTGPRLMTFADAVEEVARASGRDVAFRTIGLEELEADLVAAHVPADLVELTRYLFTEVLDGRNASVGDGVQRALGRPPREFTAYARTAAAAGVWDPASAVPVR